MLPRSEIVRFYIERNCTVLLALRTGYDYIPVQQNEHGTFPNGLVALPGLIYGQLRVAADVNDTIVAYPILCNAAGLKLGHIDINGKVNGIESLLDGSFAYFCYSYNLIIYCKLKVLVCVCAIYD